MPVVSTIHSRILPSPWCGRFHAVGAPPRIQPSRAAANTIASGTIVRWPSSERSSWRAGTGALTGTPTAAGSYNFTITATDSSSATGSRPYTVTVAAAPTRLDVLRDYGRYFIGDKFADDFAQGVLALP